MAGAPDPRGRAASAPVASTLARAEQASVLSVILGGLLASIKLSAGVVGGSFALVADGLESVFDIFSSLLVWGGLRVSARPPSDQFPYGHGRAEQLASLAVATMLLAGAGVIAVGAVRAIRTPQGVPDLFTLPVLIGVVVVKEIAFRVLSRRASETGSTALASDAWHHRSDALTSLAAFLGISISVLGGPGFETADGWAALFACLVIVVNAGRLFRATAHELLDAAPSPLTLARVREVAEGVEGVAAVEQVRVRKSGLELWVDLHVEVDGALPVRRGHEIAHDVKDALFASELAIADALIHVEPAPLPPGSGGAG